MIHKAQAKQFYSTKLHRGARFNSSVSFTDNLDINLPCSNSTWELFSLINCVHFTEVYLGTILFILVSLVSGMRIVFATQNQVRQCGPGIPTSPLQSMYWKFSRDIHFPIYSYCAIELRKCRKSSQLSTVLLKYFLAYLSLYFFSTESLWLKPVKFSKTLKQVNLLYISKLVCIRRLSS